MRKLRIDNFEISTPILTILEQLRLVLNNGKLRDIKPWHEGEDNIVVTCPHHAGGKEATPACCIYVGNDNKVEYGYFKCWVCDERGSFVKFVAECFECPEERAKDWLITNFGIEVEKFIDLGEDIDIFKKYSKKIPKLDINILNQFQSWHPYLQQRGLTREICELFKIKYDSYQRQIVFPCFDKRGNLIMLPRRSIDSKTFYLDKLIDKPVYCLDYVEKNNYSKAVLVEGPFDALTANQYGLPYNLPAIATFGNPSNHQIEQINKSCIKVLYIMFDNDLAGYRFYQRVMKNLSPRILTHFVQIPNGKKDVNDLTFDEFKDAIVYASSHYGYIK